MKQNDKRFEAYARLIVEVGSNVQVLSLIHISEPTRRPG